MRIGRLSRRTGISTSRVRFYEKHAVLPKPIRGENGYREDPDRAAKMLSLINDAQRLGFSLNEIRAPASAKRRSIFRRARRWSKRCEVSLRTSTSI
jgi:MerR family transcriptional regulator, copper efflux regulator